LVAEGPRDLSFCNFAAGFDCVPSPQQRLEWIEEMGRKEAGFWVFCMDGDDPPHSGTFLQSRGFVLRQNLIQMSFTAFGAVDQDIQLAETKLSPERVALCRFAAKTFFTRSPESTQWLIADATAASKHRLYGLKDQIGTAAAMMVSESPNTFGIYNLCVRRDLRHQGIGRKLVNHAANLANLSNKGLVLQCDSKLVEWYEGLGFQSFGAVQAYTYAAKPWHDIM
jgi:ribosomal protein S18 acetylase RimI-like enzyme